MTPYHFFGEQPMAGAIIRHLTSGEYYLADLDDSGNAKSASAQIPVFDEFGPEFTESKIDPDQWSHAIRDYDLESWDDDDERWTADKFQVVHRFD